MARDPKWLSQEELFKKLPHDLFVLWSANFSAHTHKETMLFKKSIMEQRMRFYGNQRFNEIIYGNSRKARDPPAWISGDETITRMYTRKASDIRMRTQKKNESGLLNQNLCGSNEGYVTWKKGDPKCGGYTYANMAYPGSSYSIGSVFREKDMGNLLQLIFSCGDYFRYRDVELVCDSHFGHMVPIAFLRLWKVYSTCSFGASTRIGLSNLTDLSTKKLEAEELATLLESVDEKTDINAADSKPETSDVVGAVGHDDKKVKYKEFRRVKTRFQFFEKKLSMEKKGSFKVWRTELSLLENLKVKVYLHAILDSKVVYRVSNRYAGLPLSTMSITDIVPGSRKKEKIEIQTTPAHRCFRMKMGFNDQSDAKRSFIGLSSKFYKRWPQKLLAKTFEDLCINAYANYLLDCACAVEPWPVFLYQLVQELIDSGENMRKRKMNPHEKFSRSNTPISKRPRPGSDKELIRGSKCRGGRLIAAVKLLPRSKRTRVCAFCGRQKAAYKCRHGFPESDRYSFTLFFK